MACAAREARAAGLGGVRSGPRALRVRSTPFFWIYQKNHTMPWPVPRGPQLFFTFFAGSCPRFGSPSNVFTAWERDKRKKKNFKNFEGRAKQLITLSTVIDSDRARRAAPAAQRPQKKNTVINKANSASCCQWAQCSLLLTSHTEHRIERRKPCHKQLPVICKSRFRLLRF